MSSWFILSDNQSMGLPQKKLGIKKNITSLNRNQKKTSQSYDPSVSSPFNTLPNEAIEHLFTFLDRVSLKMSLLVDKRWKEIISSSLKVMKKLPLTIQLIQKADLKEMKKFERRYRVVLFKNVEKKLPKNIEDALAMIGSEVESVTFSDCSFEHKILEVLNCFPKVNNVVIEAEEFDRSAKPKVQLDSNVIKNLKTLKINRVASIIESFAGADQLTKLLVNPVSNDWRQLIDLLSTQTRLKTLQVLNMNDIPADVELMPMQCQVQTLKVNGFLRGISDQIQQFVKLFGSSAVKLEIEGVHLQLLLPMVCDNFKVLKHLTLIKFVSASPEFFEQQQPTKLAGLEFLCIHGAKFRNSSELFRFFSLFPSIKQLQILSVDFDASITPGDIRNVTQGLLSVESLVVHETVEILKHAAFKNVSDIHLMTFDAAEKINWKSFVDDNPKMKLLVIQMKCNEDQLDFEALMRCYSKKLCLHITGEVKVTKKRLRILVTNSARSIRLVILKSSLTMNEKNFDKITENHRNLIQLI